jgi:dienelactone hydrolase
MANEDLQRFEYPEPNSDSESTLKRRTVFWLGQGPGVVLMHEVFGLTDVVVDFGRVIAKSGYTVFMPVMFGTPFPDKTGRALNAAGLCIDREFLLLARRTSSPITDWLRALCRYVHERCNGPGVGAIGLCLSGGFVLSMMVDKSVIAPVMGEPSLPGSLPIDCFRASQAALGISPEELEIAKQRSQAEDIPVVGLRFSNDWICPGRRFETLEQQFPKFTKIVIPSGPDNQFGIPKSAHSVLTEHYSFLKDYKDKTGIDPREQVIAFLDKQFGRPSH